MLSISCYDNYKYMKSLPAAGIDTTRLTYDNAKTEYGQKYNNAKGLLTGTRIYLLDGSDNYIVTTYYYDYRGRLIQTHSNNHLGGYDRVYNQYDFTGNVTKNLKEHCISTTLNNPLTELYEYTYDHAGRLIDTKYKKGSAQVVLLSKNEYDELGRLTTKKRHNNTDTEQFEYNIRNWTTKIISGEFTQNIYYQSQPGSNNPPYFNGNISSVTYSGHPYDEDAYFYGYNFRYDELNRLTNTTYVSGSLKYTSESFQYDKQGNIVTLVRKMTHDYMIDSLYFRYTGNQLKTIDDYNTTYTGAIYGLKEYTDIHNTKTNDQITFLFDANGNMTTDRDRNIVTIRYNLLNLPDTIQFKNGSQIINTYDAGGGKLRTAYKTSLVSANVPLGDIYIGSATQFRNDGEVVYIDNFEYAALLNAQGGLRYYQLDKTHHAEGYNGKYFRRDHLGNVREVWNTEYDYALQTSNTTPQITHYYSSGLPWYESKGADVQSKKFGGKEFIEMHGYDMYDFAARVYDPLTERFTTMDPLAEKYYSISPYAYCANNPINAIDPDGKDIVVLNNPKGARGYGHSAVLIGNDKTGWRFVSKEGRNKEPWYSNELTGGPAFTPKTGNYATLKDFRTAQTEDSDLGGYTQDVRFATNSKQDRKALNATEESAKSWYSALFNNCVDAVSDGLKAAGLDPGFSVLGANNPYADPSVSLSPVPNIRFNEIKKNNSSRTITTDTPQKESDSGRDVNSIIQSFLMKNPNIKVYVY